MYALLEAAFSSLLVLSLVEDFVSAQDYTAVPRWGQASALVNDVLFIHGGRTDQYNSYGYSSAPVTNDILYLPLNTSFDLSAPPWQYLAGCLDCASSQGPAVAWHTLTPFNTSNLLLFGGDAGPNGPIANPEEADSAALLNVSNRLTPVWNFETESWANEPLRRIYHTACESGGKVFLIGGEKTDGSGNAFSDHYVYDPHGPSFSQLPSTNGPPDLLGHASVVLSDRRLLVFGGYSPSENSLMSFSTIWSLDTATSNYTWHTLQVSDTVLPAPRRGFVAAALDNGKVLIQGGADADMQNVLDDGWILDTAQNPAVWSSVAALSDVGPRRDHFAVAAGSEVFFGFGFGQSAPVDASLLLFDASKGSFLSSYTPPPAVASPTATTLPGPTGTSRSPAGTGTKGGTSATSSSSPTDIGDPGNNGNGGGDDPQGNSSKSHATAVALGVVLGVLGLVAGGAAAYYLSTRRRASHDSFHLLGPSDDDDSPHLGPVIPVAGAGGSRSSQEKGVPVMQSMKEKLAGLVPGKPARNQPIRRDMLADEDTRVFEPSWYDVRREGSIASWSTRGGVRPTLEGVVQGSLTSLRNVGGAMLAYATGNRRQRDVSGTSSNTFWEKEPSYGYSDKTALVALPSLNKGAPAARPKGGREASYTSHWSYYEDPFADYDVESFKMPGDDDYEPDAVELHGAPALNDPPPKPYMYSRVAPATVDITRLSPLSEKPSFATVSDPTSSSSDMSHANPLSSSENSRSSQDVPQSPRRPSSIIDANPPITANMRRSDTWWSRFAKTPLLDRTRSTDSGRTTKVPLDFRDPNPPPRLVPIKESSGSPTDAGPTKRGSRDDPMYASVHHGRSATSLQTSKTADSEQIEQMGRTMDIVHRDTVSSHGSRTSGGSVDSGASYEPSPPQLSVFIPMETHAEGVTTTAAAQRQSLVQSPSALTPLSPTMQQPGPAPARRATGNVAARVEAFEQQARSPPPALPPRKKTGRNSVYGLAPKPSLFVANPDRRSGSGDS